LLLLLRKLFLGLVNRFLLPHGVSASSRPRGTKSWCDGHGYSVGFHTVQYADGLKASVQPSILLTN
ncbi:MAG TPA: hypothetical protein VF772_12815, partial [Terriglobales bacterium]